MRKIVILAILVLSIWCCYQTIVVGADIGTSLSISNYKEVESASKQIDTLISQLVNANEMEFPSKKSVLASAIKSYQSKKEEYEELKAMVEETANEPDISLVDIYDVDFLWTTIGNYGTEEGISLKFDIAKSLTSPISSTEYTMCDLKFTVSGDYIALTDFIYDLEDDNKLGFEISDFSLAKGGENLQATFTVREVPINNENLTELTTSADTSSNTNTNTNTADGNTTVPPDGTNTMDNGTTDPNNTVY